MLKKITLAVIALVAVAAIVLAAWYRIDGQPLAEASAFLHGEGYSARVEDDGALVFTPAVPNGHGLVIMHGALIRPLAYAKTAAYFAREGYLVFVPSGAARLSINAVGPSAARLPGFGLSDWVMIGHSMGGFASLQLLADHAPPVRAVALWACAMPADFSMLEMPMLFLHGDRDGLLPPSRMADVRAKLPASVEYREVTGGNHRGFALYSHQFFDGEATIGQAGQIDLANEATAAFFAARLGLRRSGA